MYARGGGGVIQMRTVCNRGGGGLKIGKNAYVINGRPQNGGGGAKGFESAIFPWCIASPSLVP